MLRKFMTAVLLVAVLLSLFCIGAYASDASAFTVSKGILTAYTGPDGDVLVPGNLGIREIGFNAFANIGITSVTIPEGVTAIKMNAFNSCKALTSVTLPNSLTSIGDGAFSNCTALLTVKLPSELKSIGNAAFYYCSKLQVLPLPEGVTFIDNGAFAYCKSITSVTWPENVTRLGYSVFSGCTALTSVNLPDTVTEIGGWAFAMCSNLKSLRLPASINKIGTSAFNLTGLPEPILINNGTVLCYVPSTYRSYAVPSTVTAINGGAFRDCTILSSVIIPDSVKEVGDEAFRSCISLTSVNIPTSVTEIGDYAFDSCLSLGSLTIPQSVNQIGGSAFSKTALTSPIISKDGKILYFVPAAVTSYTIPGTVDTIKDGAFTGCTKLTSIDIPNRITYIGQFAFSECSSLKSIVLPKGMTTIEQWMFNGCSGLSLISIPPSVTRICSRAFADCTSLTTFNIPAAVTEVEFNAFTGCSNLNTVIFAGKSTRVGQDAFQGCSQLTLYAPEGSAAENYAKTCGILFAPLTVNASLTKSDVTVNGTPVKFEAYHFNGNNYFKLRDIAYILSSTGKQFDITFDPVYSVIYITTGLPYTPVGGELVISGEASSVTASRTLSKVYLNGNEINLTAYIINGRNYLKLRDIGMALDFGVDWINETKSIAIDTSKSYS